MSNTYKSGDRVKVTFETVVGPEYKQRSSAHCLCTYDAKDREYNVIDPEYLDRIKNEVGGTVEVVEPLVETFKAGDTVVAKDTGHMYLICKAGYVRFFDMAFVECSDPGFRNDRYEKVDN